MIQYLKNYLPFIFLALLISSCSPVISELWINKDESGKMSTTFDLGEMAGMAQGMLSELGDEEDKKDGAGLWDKEEIIDSSMNFYDIMPDSIKETMTNPKILKNVSLDMHINSLKEEASMTLNIEYKNQNHLNQIFTTMKEMKKSGEKAEEQFDNMNIEYTIDVKRGIVQLPGMDISELENDPEFAQIMGSIDSLETTDPESMMLFEMMFGGESKTIVHLPGKIEFTNDMHAEIDGNTVTFRDNMMEMIKAKKSKDRIIKFKN